jgi:hypothetical protein
MKRLLVLLGVVVFAALGLSVTAQAATTTTVVTFDATFLLCNGDPIHVSGPLAIVSSETTTASGGHMMAIHFQPKGVTGVDLVTGTVFHSAGLTRDLIVSSPAGGFTETSVDRFQLQATGGAESFIVTELTHVTVTPDGTTRVFFDNFSATC